MRGIAIGSALMAFAVAQQTPEQLAAAAQATAAAAAQQTPEQIAAAAAQATAAAASAQVATPSQADLDAAAAAATAAAAQFEEEVGQLITEVFDASGVLEIDAGDIASLTDGINESITSGIDSTALDNLAAQVVEAQDIDQDDDGIPNATDPDDDNDGTPDVDDDDDDNDGIVDTQDADDDNDGVLDVAEGAVDDLLGAFGDLMDQVVSGDACLGDYVAAVGEVGDADYAEAYCITSDDDCEFCAKDGVCVAEADAAVCDTGSSAGLVVGLILGILAAVAIGIVVYCFCCKSDDDGYQKQH